jgi:hypothetical protein
VLYDAYVRFCQSNGLKHISMQAFSPLVEAHGYAGKKRKNGKFFIGIAPGDVW